MGRRILASLLAMALIFALPVFSLADGVDLILKDSGSPEVSMMAMRSIAANEGISLAAAEGNSGQYGYNIESFSPDFSLTGSVESDRFHYNVDLILPPGQYSVTLNYNYRPGWGFVWNPDLSQILDSATVVSSDFSTSYIFSLSESSRLLLVSSFYESDNDSSLSLDSLQLVDGNFSRLTPVEGVSSGYTYSSGIIPKTTRSIFETLTPSFGNQPAGKYFVNIYHWGDSYDVKFHISDSTESYYLPTSTNGGVTTLVYNHPGGEFSLDGSFTASNVETSVIDGELYGGGQGDYLYVNGQIVADGPLSWVFNITDIVAIPYEQASDSNFGFFAPIIGFFNDHFSSMKSWIATQIDKIAGDDATKATVDNAASELEQEVQDLNTLSSDLTTQAGNLEQQFSTDFAIPSEISGFSGSVQSIYSFLFSSLGVFSIFIWLPIVLAVIKKLLRL